MIVMRAKRNGINQNLFTYKALKKKSTPINFCYILSIANNVPITIHFQTRNGTLSVGPQYHYQTRTHKSHTYLFHMCIASRKYVAIKPCILILCMPWCSCTLWTTTKSTSKFRYSLLDVTFCFCNMWSQPAFVHVTSDFAMPFVSLSSVTSSVSTLVAALLLSTSAVTSSHVHSACFCVTETSAYP
jgi:hypothetical protein